MSLLEVVGALLICLASGLVLWLVRECDRVGSPACGPTPRSLEAPPWRRAA